MCKVVGSQGRMVIQNDFLNNQCLPQILYKKGNSKGNSVYK